MAPGSRDDAYVRTTFFERLAHELRGPAGVTLGALDQIERTLGAQRGEKLDAHLAMARRGVARVVRTADRLQRTARMERGTPELSLVLGDVRGIANEASRTTGIIDARHGVALDVSSSAEPCLAAIDADWLLRAIGDVVSNALHFAEAKVSVDTRAVGGEIRVTVRDDGPGFTTLPLLERFVDSSNRSGLGLSLPLVRDVLRAQGGGLEVSMHGNDGEYGGASVVLRLPEWQTPA